MKNQKQRNRSPRPFKNGQSSGNWGGNGGFIPQPSPTSKAAKKSPAKTAPPKPDEPASPEQT